MTTATEISVKPEIQDRSVQFNLIVVFHILCRMKRIPLHLFYSKIEIFWNKECENQCKKPKRNFISSTSQNEKRETFSKMVCTVSVYTVYYTDAQACVGEELSRKRFCELFACFGFVPTWSNQTLKTVFILVSLERFLALLTIISSN